MSFNYFEQINFDNFDNIDFTTMLTREQVIHRIEYYRDKVKNIDRLKNVTPKYTFGAINTFLRLASKTNF